MNSQNIEEFCMNIPKAELHIHIEGTFEPELMFQIAHRNDINIPYTSIEEIREKYNFSNLQEFLDIYYSNCSVLINQVDFQELMYAYLKKASTQGLKYAEIFFDPQTHLNRGIKFDTFFSGFKLGMEKAKEDFGVETELIMCFLKDLPVEESIEVFNIALNYKNHILGIGFDSTEQGNPPEKFKEIFDLAKKNGLKLCCHAAEEGPAESVRKCIELGVERIDHGFNVIHSDEIMKLSAKVKIPFTLCPLSNLRLKVCLDLKNYPIRKFIENNLLVMLNSDDPAYFGGYVGDNYVAVMKSCRLNQDEVVLLAKNSFKASFLSDEKINEYLERIEEFVRDF